MNLTKEELQNYINRTYRVSYQYYFATLRWFGYEPFEEDILVSLYNIPQENVGNFIKEKILERHSYPKPQILLVDDSVVIKEISKTEKEDFVQRYLKNQS